MTRYHSLSLGRLAFLICLALLVFDLPASAQPASAPVSAPPAPPLLSPLPAPSAPDAARPGRGVTRSRYVRAALDLLAPAAAGDAAVAPRRVGLELFPDADYIALLERREASGSGSYTWIGTLENVPGSEIILTVTGDALAATVFTLGRQFELASTGDGRYAVRQVDLSAALPEAAPLVPAGLPSAGPAASPTDPCTDIAVMIVYTANAKAYADAHYGGIDNFIANRVADINAGYANSQVNQRVHLVHTGQVSWTQTPDSDAGPWTVTTWQDALNKLTGGADGAMDEVHAWRNTYHADETLLLVDVAHGACGIGWLMQDLNPAYEAKAFAVADAWCANNLHTGAHELGHNMGSHHEHASAGTDPTIYPYSYGHIRMNGGDNNDFRTIMAYDVNCPAQPNGTKCPRVNYWSNPNILYNAMVTGVAGTGPTAADNHLSLNNTCTTVANFRTNTQKMYLPLLRAGGGGSQGSISGRLTYAGAGKGGLVLELRLCTTPQRASCSTQRTATTAADGSYSFANPPTLPAGQIYYVRFRNNTDVGNPKDPAYLAGWYGNNITAYTAGAQVSGLNFDIANLLQVAPASDAHVGLPAAFTWQKRAATPGDSYTWELFGLDADSYFQTSLLGWAAGYTVAALPAGFQAGTRYGWDMWVKDASGWGLSFYYFYVTFNGAAPQSTQSRAPGIRVDLSGVDEGRPFPPGRP